MNRARTALYSAFEAVLVVAIGIAIPLVPLTLLWGFHFQLGIDWPVFWRGAVDIWLLGHGVDVTLLLDPALAAATGIPGAERPIPITIALLGFALLTVLLGTRAGRRIAETSHRLTGEAVAIGTFAVLALAATSSALDPSARPSLWQGVLLPTLCFALGVLVGSTRARLLNPADDHGSSLRDWIDDWRPVTRETVRAALRAGTAAAAAVVTVSAIAVAVLVLLGYAQVIALYEQLHADVLGGITLTAAQLALLPDLVIWAAAWFVGPGFAIGTGSSVSPLGTDLGPLPAVPVLGALPTDDGSFAFAGVLVPVVAGFVAGALFTRALREHSPWARVVAGTGTGIVGGVLLGLLAWAAAGSAGPGRLVDVGPDPLLVGAWAALEIALAALAGAFAAGRGHRPDAGERPRRRETQAAATDRADAHRPDAHGTDRGSDSDDAVPPEDTTPPGHGVLWR
ncbi:hypothetical protein CLV46_2708 [Diaminobutyricimonas aerilata]|uniref:Uncharacterized protein n=1 Tax=Diaminobutyricimonas aerilata TaxID=1162967 RepID=A0A2M9CMP8_9MICO|nr:DUF6350 family protein [Diaminobutyricimonas aerilata]PJJ73124.1 hypothetical protein CLV46_2708 [Diaminobutyricimonas aerilata]